MRRKTSGGTSSIFRSSRFTVSEEIPCTLATLVSRRKCQREEFQVGIHEPQGLADEVKRAGIIHASAVKYAPELAAHGWTAGDATDLQSAIDALSGVDLQQETSKAQGPGLTALSTVDANQLYHDCLTIQNAARLQYPSTQPGNETPRALFLIGEFPPHGASDAGPAATNPPAGPTPPAAPPLP